MNEKSKNPLANSKKNIGLLQHFLEENENDSAAKYLGEFARNHSERNLSLSFH